jgi:ribose transport system substrate-binding protein
VPPSSIEPQIKAASAAGIKTMTAHFFDPSQTPNPLLSSSLPVSFNKIGKLLAYWAIHRTEGKAKIIVVQTDEIAPTGPLVDGIKSEIAAHCPGCEIVQHINVGITEWGTKILPSVQAALLAHPEANFILPIYDSMSQFVVPAISLVGRTKSVKLATFNGTPFVLDYIRDGKADMDIGESLDWIGRATIDAHLRDLCGLEVPKEISVPFYLFDASNVKDAGVPAQFDKGYGDEYITGFRKLWMIE